MKRRLKSLSLLLLITLFLCRLSAQELTFSKQPWTVKIDSRNGALLQLLWNNYPISSNPDKAPLINWGPKWIAGTKSAPVRLLSHGWDDKKGVLTLNTQIGEYNVTETISLGYNGDKDFFSVAVAFTYMPQNPKSEHVKFNRFVCYFPISSTGKYLLAGKEGLSTQARNGNFSDIPMGGGINSGWGVPPSLVEIAPDRTLIFMPEYRNDIASFRINKSSSGAVCAHVISSAAGWAFAGKTQHIGPFYLKVHPGPIKEAFQKAIHPMYDTIKLKAVNDTPEWFQDAVIYSFSPGGSQGSGVKDLGGFTPAREELLPRLKQLGISTIWMLPIEDGNGNRGYWPRDYYKVNSQYGTSEELKALVDAAHAAGLRVLFDSVPHGGTPANGVLRGNKPWHLAFNEKGVPASYWCYDFGDPEWQKYVADAAAYHMKKYNIDGYRIDAVIGNHYLNWRRADFPAKCPPNVNKEWWEKSLKENGGKMPPLPYARASLGCRQGGLEMLKAIRNAVESNKKDGVILAEVDHAPYMQDADAIFNFPLASTVRKTSTQMPPVEWVRNLTRWLDDGNFIYPRNSRWMQYFGSHDHPNPFGFLGIGITRTLMGYSMMLKGIPMIYQDLDIGIGIFLKQIIAVRKALPELRRGDARYTSPAPLVLSALRTWQGNTAIGLANIGPDSAKVCLGNTTPDLVPAPGRFTIWSSEKTEPVASGTFAELSKQIIDLPPYSCQVLAFRPSGTSSPFPVKEEYPVAAVQKTENFKLTEKDDEYKVDANRYRFSVSRKTGMINYFAGTAGKKLLSGAGFITDTAPELFKTTAVPAMDVSVKQEKSLIHITAVGVVANGAKITLHYLCAPDKVTIQGDLENGDQLPRLGLALKGDKITRWQVSTAEGLLDDNFYPRHLKGIPGNKMAEGYCYYRYFGTPIMWQSDVTALSFARPEITAFSGKQGVKLTFRDLLHTAPDNIALLDKIAGKADWYTAVYWKDITPYSAKKVTAARTFSFDLTPAEKLLQSVQKTDWQQVGNVKFRNVSRGWEVDNGIYRVQLLRGNGSIRYLRGKSGDVLIDQSQLFTNKGFRRLWGGPNMFATAACDGETEVSIYEKNGKLHMRFDSAIRGPGRITIVVPALWGAMEYIFDDSPDIKMNWSVISDGAPKDNPAFLGLELTGSNWNIGRLYKDGKELIRHTWLDNRKLPGKVLPDKIDICGTDGRVLFELNNIRYPENAPHPSVEKLKDKLRIAPINGDSGKVQPGHRYESSMTLTVKK